MLTDMLPDFVQNTIFKKIAKWAVTALVAWLVAHGVLGNSLTGEAIDVFMALAVGAWHWWDESHHTKLQAVAADAHNPDMSNADFRSNVKQLVKLLVLAFLPIFALGTTHAIAADATATSTNIPLFQFEASNFLQLSVQGIITNVVHEGGFAVNLHAPFTTPHACISQAYPLVKFSKGPIVEHVMFVHSDILSDGGQTRDGLGIGFNTQKRVTPNPANVQIGTVAPAAHHGFYVNLVAGTSNLIRGKFYGRDSSIQVGEYITF